MCNLKAISNINNLLGNAVHLKHCEFQHFICNDEIALPPSLISLKCYKAQYRGVKINDKPFLETLVLERVNDTMFVDVFSYNFNNLKYLELCNIPLCNYFHGNLLLFSNLKVLKLHSTCQTSDFLDGKWSELSLSLEMLLLSSTNDVKDEKELGVVLAKLEMLKQLILINMKIDCCYVNSFNPKMKIERRKYSNYCTIYVKYI